MQVHYVLEDVQSLLCTVGSQQQVTAVYVLKVAEAELVFAQQVQVYIVAIEQTDFVQQTEVQTVD